MSEGMMMMTTEYNNAEEVTLFKVEIEGRGGDSVHSAFFKTQEDAILASALDGQNLVPTEVNALKLQDGTYVEIPMPIHVSHPPSETEVASLMENLTPAQKLLFTRKK